MKDSPSPPPAPDYKGAAQAQGEANVQAAMASARASNPNVISPYGTQTVTWGGGAPDYASYEKAFQDWQSGGGQGPMPQLGNFTTGETPTITQTLTPESQAIFNQQQALRLGMTGLGQTALQTANGVLGTKFDTSGIPQMPVNAGSTAQDAILSRVMPQQALRRQQTETQLVNQGLRPGMEAYDNAMKNLAYQENDERNQAALQGVNVDLQANQQGFQQEAYKRALPLNEISALMSGSQIQNPQFQGFSGSNIAPSPVFNALQAGTQYNQGLYNAQMGAQNANTAGMYGLGAAAIGAMAASDRRLKSNIVRVGTHPLGIGWYEYDIFDRRERGVMADEAETVMPIAVATGADGYKRVNYALIGRI